MIAPGLESLAVPVATLVLLPGNPRRGDVNAIARSLAEFGQRKPVTARRYDRVVTAGNHTVLAARQLGWREVAVLWTDDDENKSLAWSLADNRVAELGGYDDVDLAAMMASVYDADMLVPTGWTDADLADLVAKLAQTAPNKPLPDDTEAPHPPTTPITADGDMWQLGPHMIICGDCREPGIVERLLAGRAINVAFTSPPYASQRKYDENSEFAPIPPDEYVAWFAGVQANVRSHLAEDGSWFINLKEHAESGQRHLYVKDLTLIHVREWGWLFVDEFAWPHGGVPGAWPGRFKNAWEPIFHFTTHTGHKHRPWSVAVPSNGIPVKSSEVGANTNVTNGSYWNRSDISVPGLALPSNVIRVSGVERGLGHTAPFPVKLPTWFIRAFSDVGDTVYDPFIGSGTTLIASANEGRTCYGCEISPAYCDVICHRYQSHTGELPKRQGVAHDFLK